MVRDILDLSLILIIYIGFLSSFLTVSANIFHNSYTASM